MQGIPWYLWSVLAAVIAYAEMHVPGAYLIWIGLGAAVTAALDVVIGLSLKGQLTTFIAASALSCGIGFFVYRRVHAGKPKSGEEALNERNMSMIGAKGTVCQALSNGVGKVRLGDSVWLAEGPDLAEGTAVVVTAVRGARVIVTAP